MTVRWILLFTLIYSCLFAQNHLSSDRYFIQLDTVEPQRVKVDAQITLEDSLLYMSQNGPMPHQWLMFIDRFEVFDETGQPLDFEYQDSIGWLLKNAKAGKHIRLSYHVLMEHEKIDWPGGIDGVAFVKDWGIMASGRSLFIMNGGFGKTNLQVSFKLPDNWKLSCPWKQSDGTPGSYGVPNLTQLQESLLFMGAQEEVLISREGFHLKFVLGGEDVIADQQQYVERAGAVLDYYIDLMGGIPNPEPGNDLSQVIVMINQAEQIDGEVIGNHISMFLNPNADMQGQIMGWFLFAHEFFHLWNGKSIRFEGTEVDWFKEGATNYYTLKALNNAGFIGEEEIKLILNNLFYSRYLNDPGYGKLALTDAASGFDKDNHWGLVYGGGMFASICLDMEIRHASRNAKSLDGIMRGFYEKCGGTDEIITNADILKAVNQLADHDLSGFMNAFVRGADILPLGEYMKYAGVKVNTGNGQMILTHMENKNELQKKIWSGFLGE